MQIFINQLGKAVSTELKRFKMGSSPERKVTKNHANEDMFKTHDKWKFWALNIGEIAVKSETVVGSHGSLNDIGEKRAT